MPRYDATTKHLVESAPLDWVALAGFPHVRAATTLDADVSTVTAQADKVILVEEEPPWIIHIEFQSTRDKYMGLRLCRYNVLLEYRHQFPVLSVLVLLSANADQRDVNGTLRRSLPDGTCYNEFRYHVIRVWELPVETVMAGGLGTLPLAPLSGVPESELPSIIERIKTRVDREIQSPDDRKEFWESATFLLGMRVPWSVVKTLLQGALNMKESSVIQGLLEEGAQQGRIDEARKFLSRLAEHQFGRATPLVLDQINSVSDPELLEELGIRIKEVSSWEQFSELLLKLQNQE